MRKIIIILGLVSLLLLVGCNKEINGDLDAIELEYVDIVNDTIIINSTMKEEEWTNITIGAEEINDLDLTWVEWECNYSEEKHKGWVDYCAYFCSKDKEWTDTYTINGSYFDTDKDGNISDDEYRIMGFEETIVTECFHDCNKKKSYKDFEQCKPIQT